ncbi:MAG: hypothetical protein A3J49_00030 [Gallionellales bacterium RIFCSPHIGHO2_02_FULL_57_16]|nr:MAG: hypothetical protein A3J49_00030 [Gallionellales bacterium RIFCSPHIGHO2_02_FULL_57_16]
MFEKKQFTPYALASLMALGIMSGCATQPEVAESKSVEAQTAEAKKANYFLVFHENGRIYAFGDTRNYLMFLENGEVPLTRTRIGGGPEGQTVIFGITKSESKNLDRLSSGEMFYDGKMGEADPFYGEVLRDGRFYVFGEWKDFQDYLAHKEVTFTFTEIGTGPKGETVIYALNSKTKKQGRPVALIEAFKQLRKAK